MIRVPIKNARPGMRLAAEVLHPHNGNVLLKWGFVLGEHIIAKLEELRIHEVWVQYPGTDAIREFISPAILQKRGAMFHRIADLFAKIHRNAHVKLEFDDYIPALRDLIEAVMNDKAACSYIVEMGGGPGSDLRHSAEVCFLSLLLGIKLQSYLVNQRKRLAPESARDISCLGIGAILHDVGYLTLDRQVRERYDQTRDQSDAQWQSHVEGGYRLVSGSIKPAAAGVIMQHHQHYDGSGFPLVPDNDGRERGMSGDEIHIFARIVAVADQFDRLLNPADGSTPPRVRVLREMLFTDMASWFDPVVLDALPLVVPAYPPGTVVGLSNGESGVVIQWNPRQPCRPVVQPLPDDVLSNSEPPEGEIPQAYDLSVLKDLQIVEQDGQDVREDNFTLSATGSHRWIAGPTPPETDAEAA